MEINYKGFTVNTLLKLINQSCIVGIKLISLFELSVL